VPPGWKEKGGGGYPADRESCLNTAVCM